MGTPQTEAKHFSMFTLVAFFFVPVAFQSKSDTPNCEMQSDKAIFGIREIQGQGLNCEFVFVCLYLYLCICNLLIVNAIRQNNLVILVSQTQNQPTIKSLVHF